MVVTIYSTGPSPPCRAVLLTAKNLGLPVNVKEVDLLNGGTKTQEYLKLNPQHTVPTMDDNGLILSESRAIMEYLSDAHGKTDSLYPRNTKTRAKINVFLYFDATNLYFKTGLAYLGPLFRGMERSEAHITVLNESLEVFNKMIGDQALYVVGDSLTIADITLAVTISNIEVCGHDFSKLKNVTRWFNNAKKVIKGYDEINQKGADFIGQYHQQKYGSSQQ